MADKYKWDKSNLPKVDSKWGTNASLGDKIEQMFTRFVQRVILWVVDFVSDRLVDIFDQSMKIMSPGTERATKDIFSYMRNVPGIPESLRSVLNAAEKETGESGFILRVGVFFVAIRSILLGGLDPMQRLVNYNADKQLRSFLPDPSTVAFMHHIGLMGEEGFTLSMQQLGVHDKLIPVYQELAKRLPSIGEIVTGKWRGTISESEFDDLLKRQGYDPKAIALYRELAINIPPLSDLIHMLVRDAFNDGAAGRYGYDEDFPQEINEFFAKQGYSPDWAKRYWRSHWNLPSPTQGYEMLHRGLIDTSDLETLLRISDYPKFWRDKLRDISYNVLTRVDVRRLLQAGIIDEGKTLETYKKMGYTPEDAELLTQFAVAGITQEERDLTKTDILNMYEEGVIDRDTAAGNLVKMGYDSDESESILKLSDVNIAKAARADLINFVKERYLAKKIDENQAQSELSQIGLKSQSVDRYLLNWQRATEIESAIPSMADIKSWYLLDYIDENKLRLFLAQHRHTEENITLYVRHLNDKKQGEENEQQA